MNTPSLDEEYRQKTDDELLRLAVEADQLTDEARQRLHTELSRRRLDKHHIEKFRVEEEKSEREYASRVRLVTYQEIGRRWYGKFNKQRVTDDGMECFSTTVFFVIFAFPLIPLGTYRVQKKRTWWSRDITILEKLPLDWEQVLTVWVIAAAILLTVMVALRIAIHFALL